MWLLVLKRLTELIGGLTAAPSAGPSLTSETPSTPSPVRSGLELTLIRKWKTERSTVGELYVDGVFECYTLEDRDRLSEGLQKVSGATAIPGGTYAVRLALSPKRGYVVPWIDGVPQFSYVQIHRGTKPEDSDGCVLTGRLRGPDQIAESKQAFDELMLKLSEAKAAGRAISIQIQDS